MTDTSTAEPIVETSTVEPTIEPVEPVVEPVEPQEPIVEPEPPLLAGKYKSPEELEKAYTEAQRLISEQGAKIKASEQPALPADKQQILDELKSMGVVTKADMDKHNAIQTQQAKDNTEIQALGLNDAEETILRNYANSSSNLSKSMSDCWNELQVISGKKIVSKKTTIKPKTGTRSGFTAKSSTELSKLSKEDYDKYWVDYASNKAGQ